MTERRIEMMPLNGIKLAEKNAKRHDLGAIIASMQVNGFGEAPMIDERTGRLVAGHGRLEALKVLCEKRQEAPRGVNATNFDEWFIPVQRGWASRNDAEAQAYLVASNRDVELGGWNDEELNATLQELAKAGDDVLRASGYDGDDIDKFIEDAAAESAEDDVPEESKEVWVKSGDLYELGKHRLLVGDSTVPEDLARLLGGEKADAVITDPPYAIYGSSTGIGSDIADDKMVRPFFESIFKTVKKNTKQFAHAYLFTDWRSWASMWEAAKRAEMSPKNCLVWDKGGGGMGASWAQCYELIGYFANMPKAMAMKSAEQRGTRTVFKPNIQRFNRVTGKEREHNAAKPVALLEVLVEAATEPGELVLELFDGSGSTRIACEKTGRRCYGMEIEPKFAQIGIERWQRHTGQEAKKLE